MNEKCGYLNFIKEKGRNISEINPGSDEIGLKVNDALKGIELLKNERVPILGWSTFYQMKLESLLIPMKIGTAIKIQMKINLIMLTEATSMR